MSSGLDGVRLGDNAAMFFAGVVDSGLTAMSRCSTRRLSRLKTLARKCEGWKRRQSMGRHRSRTGSPFVLGIWRESRSQVAMSNGFLIGKLEKSRQDRTRVCGG